MAHSLGRMSESHQAHPRKVDDEVLDRLHAVSVLFAAERFLGPRECLASPAPQGPGGLPS